MNLIIFFAAIVIYLNIVATYHAWSIDYFSKAQRLLQSLLIWVFPILGSVTMIGFYFSDKDYINEQKVKKRISKKIINLLTFITFFSGSGGGINGACESSDNNSGGFDSCGGDGGDC